MSAIVGLAWSVTFLVLADIGLTVHIVILRKRMARMESLQVAALRAWLVTLQVWGRKWWS